MTELTAMRGKLLISFLFAGTIYMMLVMRFHGKPLMQVPTAQAGILSLEFAKTKTRAAEIVTAWSSISSKNLRQHAIINTHIDFAFILFYSLFLFTACYAFSMYQQGSLRSISKTISLFGLKAGLPDVVENFFLLRMLHNYFSEAEVRLTWWLALIKFSLAAIAVLWILFSLVHLLIKKPKSSFI
jgi:hypothetical protein